MPVTHARYITAKDAAQLLNVKPATLYAYVSRGLIRSELTDDSSRERRYLAEDVHKLLARKEQRRDPTKAAQDALRWGTPLLDSAITLIDDHHLYYRGQDACGLAVEHSFEEVAALLWTGDMRHVEHLFAKGTRHHLRIPDDLKGLPTPQLLQILLAAVSAQDFAAYNLNPSAVAQTGARILHLMTDILVGGTTEVQPIAATLAQAWSTNGDVLNAALILCADHELNASSFAARVAASVEANPYQVVIAGLAALQGFKHGGYTEKTSALLREVDTPANAHAVLGERLRHGERIPGFGHHLYPQGDPRALTLLSLLHQHFPTAPALTLTDAIIQAAYTLTSQAPTIDLALAAVEATLKLPRGAAFSLFALGRAAGWIGHAIEQYTSGSIIRPRARYVGKLPSK
jgi:citrate synthase